MVIKLSREILNDFFCEREQIKLAFWSCSYVETEHLILTLKKSKSTQKIEKKKVKVKTVCISNQQFLN